MHSILYVLVTLGSQLKDFRPTEQIAGFRNVYVHLDFLLLNSLQLKCQIMRSPNEQWSLIGSMKAASSVAVKVLVRNLWQEAQR